jgi:succinate dehydrogenase hydrophobic anchor subunit
VACQLSSRAWVAVDSAPSRQRIIAAVVFVVGLVFLATAGADLIVKRQSRGATETFFGVLLVSVAIHRWLGARR